MAIHQRGTETNQIETEEAINNGIVYSFHLRHGELDDLMCYKELLYSIDTLRKYNKNIPIKIFISPPGSYSHAINKINHENVEIIDFVNDYGNNWNEDWIKQGYAEFLVHRWKNALSSIEMFNFDNILYLDTDTIFYKDPEILFEKYGGSYCLWAKPDNTDFITKKLGIYPALNDGQFILSKEIAVQKENILNHMNWYVNDIIEKTKNILNEEEHHMLLWLTTQYSVYDYFNKQNNPIMHFNPYEVTTDINSIIDNLSELVLHHYYTNNAEIFLPEKYHPFWFKNSLKNKH
jgi:hypothetical protein